MFFFKGKVWNQIEMVSLEDFIPETHNYRKFDQIWSFKSVEKKLKQLEKNNPYKGLGLLRLFKCLLLQFMENLSDREPERYIQENTAAKWLCRFSLRENTPDHTTFCKVRHKIGTKILSKIFADLRDQLRKQRVMNEVFSFVDTTHLIAKANLWKERDNALQTKYKKLNNEVLPTVAGDRQARIGCKGNNKFWYGYKKHINLSFGFKLLVFNEGYI